MKLQGKNPVVREGWPASRIGPGSTCWEAGSLGEACTAPPKPMSAPPANAGPRALQESRNHRVSEVKSADLN